MGLHYDRLVRAVNRKEYDKALECVEELKSKIDLRLPYNRQEIERMGNYVLFQSKKIDSEEFAQRVIATLEDTIDVSKLVKQEAFYFTRAELSCLHDLSFEVEANVSELCLRIIETVCRDAINEGAEVKRIFPNEYIIERLASKYGDEGRYEESNEMSRIILKECLKHYRIERLALLIYNQVWNDQQDCANEICDKTYIDRKLEMCRSLSILVKKYNAAAFFQKKKDGTI